MRKPYRTTSGHPVPPFNRTDNCKSSELACDRGLDETAESPRRQILAKYYYYYAPAKCGDSKNRVTQREVHRGAHTSSRARAILYQRPPPRELKSETLLSAGIARLSFTRTPFSRRFCFLFPAKRPMRSRDLSGEPRSLSCRDEDEQTMPKV